MATVRQLLTEAARHIGTAESPPGSNKTPFGAWYGWQGVPWCAIYTSYIASKVGMLTKFGGKIAWVPDYVAHFKKLGRYDRKPRPGDLFILKDQKHVGLVESVTKDGKYIYTNEGNTSNKVMRLKRAVTSCEGFCHPAYDAEPKPAPKPKATAKPKPKPTARTYTVKRGDSLWVIAQAHGVTGNAAIAAWVKKTHALNRKVIGSDPGHIEPGMKLVLP